MSTTDSTAVDLGDPELITRVRAGDVEAFGELFARHRDAANRLARVLAGATDGDDLVSEAFVKVLNVLLAGGGPDVAFRAYLLTAVRRLHVDRIRSVQRVSPTDDMESHDLGVPFTDTAVAAFEGGAAARAFASLPERWQMVLWHLEVENQKPAEIAPLLAMSANSVSALAYRAREGLRQAFLTMHAAENADEDCERTRDLLGGYVRAALSRRDSVQVRDHLEGCRRCTGAYLELVQVNTSLAALLGPVVLGGAAAAYAGSGVVAGGGAIGVLVAGLDRAKDFVANNLSVVGAVAAAVVAVAVAGGFAVSGGQTVHPRADAPPTTPGRTAPSSAPSPATPTTPTDAKPSSASKSPGMAENGVVSSPLSDAVTPAAAGAAALAAAQAATQAATEAATEARPDAGPKITKTRPPKPSTPTKPAPTKPAPAKPEATHAPEPAGAELSVEITVGPQDQRRTRIDVRVLGVPAGQKARLTLTAQLGDLTALGAPSCTVHGSELKCLVGSGRTSYSFEGRTTKGRSGQSRAPSSGRIRASVVVPAGLIDSVLGNNLVTAHTFATWGRSG